MKKNRAIVLIVSLLMSLGLLVAPASTASATVLPPRRCGSQECWKAQAAWDAQRAAKLAEKSAAVADWEGPCSTTSGIFCPYDWSDGLFPLDTVSGGIARNTCTPIKLDGTPVGSGVTSSIWNRTTTRWWVFRTSTCGGSHKDVPPNTKIVDAYEAWGFGWDGVGWVMRTSSTT